MRKMGIAEGIFEDKRQLFLERVFDFCKTSFASDATLSALTLADNKCHTVTAIPEDLPEVIAKKAEARKNILGYSGEAIRDPEVIGLAVALTDQTLPAGRHFLRTVVSRHLHLHTVEDWENLRLQQANDEISRTWITTYLENHPEAQFSAIELTAYLETFPGASYFEKLLNLRNNLVQGILEDDLPRAQFLAEAFQAMEKRDQTEIFLKSVGTLIKLGEKNGNKNFTEQYLSLMHGFQDETVEMIDGRMEEVISKLKEGFVTWKENINYFELMQQIKGDTSDPAYEPNAYFRKIYDQLGFATPGLDPGEILFIYDPDHISPQVATASFFFIPQGLDFSELEKIYPEISEHSYWSAIQQARIVIIARGNVKDKDQARFHLHETGHALQYLLSRTERGADPDRTLILGEAATQSEIFSSLMELFHPDKEFIMRWKRFLTIRFAALTQFELRLWQRAKELVMKDQSDISASVGGMIDFHDRAYQDTLGKALSCETPKRLFDGAGGDFSRPFYHTAGYVYGDIIAKVLHAKLEKLSEASLKRSLLESFAGALSQNDSPEYILDSLEISWDEAMALYAEE